MIIIPTLVFFAIFLVLGGIIYFFAFYFLRIKHLIQNTPTSKIRSIAMGFAEVWGKVIPFDKNGLLTSPFSKEKCVYYKYRIQEYRSSGKNSSWVTIKKGVEKKLFFIEDETGRILVDPTKAYIDISRDNTFNSGLGQDPPYTVIQFLKSQNIRFEGPIFGINKRMRFIESFIKPNDRLYVMGTVEDNPFVKDASVIDGVTDMMITKGKNIKFYCISDKFEKSIKLQYSIISGVLFLIGTIILILTLIAILKTVI
jgi:hypothetical protein